CLFYARNKVLGHAATVDQTRIWLYYRGRSPFFEDLYRSARPPVRHLAGTVGRAESHRPARGPEAVGTRRPAPPAADQPHPLARSARRQLPHRAPRGSERPARQSFVPEAGSETSSRPPVESWRGHDGNRA